MIIVIIGITDHSIDRLPIFWMLYLVLGLRFTFFFYYASNFTFFLLMTEINSDPESTVQLAKSNNLCHPKIQDKIYLIYTD